MNRVILTPATLPSSALAELKQWLGITFAADDAPLQRLLSAALEACEGFTGTMPLEQICEQVLDSRGCWQALATRPVQAMLAVERVAEDGTRVTLAPDDYDVELHAGGTGYVRVLSPKCPGRIAVRFTAGLATEWDLLPESLRHGIVRLAAHQHRERESAGASSLPPASVAALWRPWRRVRLA
ncbi:phage head-tail connector protein [Novosphingobium sp. RD2P27]|uniref:Phage head-tail connector protein n=1 Tax=Novosphingobium kalidii TaxID=3230299 RepID=A0ABV2CZK8_9SPHN